ncbi:acid-activated periplasmic chaperone HdeA [Microvirga subterranea]|uniref:Acid stress chaperone HdeA n=1 Tax=Microvirga subterranea TaxID=186651 RepID=A0A370HN76_9HYPH|nr:acid-activated periplasmic chaperone HdeA [Microvirga subterranea]RDI59780.1 acid stress chaperone HdeA [Microvirga subterranea]
MKAAVFALNFITIGILGVTAVQAQQPAGSAGKAADAKKPLTEWTCADFMGADDTFRPKLVYWATAYSKAGKPEAAIVDVRGTESVVPIVAEECRKTPQETFLQKLDAAWKSFEKKL